jgi:hypothetical protein
MNAVFAAHRINVVVDSVLISVKMSLFLNQAAILTNGFSITLMTRPKCLMQYLLTITPLSGRKYIVMTKVKAIDYNKIWEYCVQIVFRSPRRRVHRFTDAQSVDRTNK